MNKNSYNKNVSPVDWYVGTYVIRFIELQDQNSNYPESRFIFWQNTIIVKAKNLDEAHEKIVEVASDSTEPYKGGPKGIDVTAVPDNSQ